MCGGMCYLAWFCSHKRNQAVSFYLTITLVCGFMVLDTAWRNVWTCWHHPWLKADFFMTWLWFSFCVSCAGLLWISIHPYAIDLKAAMDRMIDLREIMVMESNFYNLISAVEFRGAWIDSLMALTIVWTQVRYHMICKADDEGNQPGFVLSQIQEVSA